MENEIRNALDRVDKRVDEALTYVNGLGKVMEQHGTRIVKLEDTCQCLTKDNIVISKDMDTLKTNVAEIKTDVRALGNIPAILESLRQSTETQNDKIRVQNEIQSETLRAQNDKLVLLNI